MSYVPPSGSSVGVDFTSTPYVAPNAGSVALEFDPTDVFNIRQAGGILAPSVPSPSLTNQRQNLFASGTPPPDISGTTVERVSLKIYPPGIEAPATVPSPQFIYNQLAFPSGVLPPDSYVSVDRVRLLGGYLGVPGSNVILDFSTGAYFPPPASSTILEFGSEGFTNVLGAGAINSSSVGTPTITQQAGAFGVTAGNTSSVGTPTVSRTVAYVFPQGISAPTLSSGHLVTSALQLVTQTTGISAPVPSSVNTVSYYYRTINPVGISAPTVPNPSVRYSNSIFPAGISAPVLSTSTTITNLLQVLLPQSIVAPIPSTNTEISDYFRTINPVGIAASAVPTPTVGRINSILPTGIPAPAINGTVVSNRSRVINPSGISAPAVSTSNRIFNQSELLPSGISAPVVSSGTVVANRNRTLTVPSIGSSIVSTQTVVIHPMTTKVIFTPTISDSVVSVPVISITQSPSQSINITGISNPTVSSGSVVIGYPPDTVDPQPPLGNPCYPTYQYRPEAFAPSASSCQAPNFSERRSRLTTGGVFFRSINQGPQTNLLAVELASNTFRVYFNNVIVETYSSVVMGAGGIAALRARLATSEYIRMPAIGVDINDGRVVENDTILGGLNPIAKTSLVGGSGPPIDAPSIAAIRTGPSRTICVLQTSENNAGSPVGVYQAIQWNGTKWINYSNEVQGSCPIG